MTNMQADLTDTEHVCVRLRLHTWDNGAKVGGLAGVAPRVDVGSSHCRGTEAACTPTGASCVAGKDCTTTCRFAQTSGSSCKGCPPAHAHPQLTGCKPVNLPQTARSQLALTG